jgi:hypothetical protein
LDGFVFVLPAIEMSIVIASHPANDKWNRIPNKEKNIISIHLSSWINQIAVW